MSLSNPRAIYGVHSVTPYSRTTGEFYGILKVLASSTLAIEGSLNELMGGSSKYPWAVEDGQSKAELSLKFSEYPDFVFELFLGKAPSANSAETSGNASTLTNKKGTSVVAATGLASVGIKAASKADAKFGKYVVKAASSTTVDVYASTDADFARGTDKSFESDLLKITASPLSITTSTAVEVPGFGIELTGGAGTIGMTVGDTATFEVRPINEKSSTVVIGSAAYQSMPEFGAIVVAQKRGNGELVEVDCYRCKGSGMPLGFEQNAWSSADVKVKAFYDSEKDGVLAFRHVYAP